jgi:hypothetical protein
VLKNSAFIYDQAMSILSFLAVGDNARAQLIADSLIYARTNDRYYTDGRMRNGYSSGDLISWPGWNPNGKTGVVRTPGWWDYPTGSYYEDKYAFSTSTGNLAWVMLAMLSYYQKIGGQIYLDTAVSLGDWVYNNTYSAAGKPGFKGGFDGWEPSPTNIAWKSTEHNLDLYAAYTRLFNITGTAKWAQYATNAYNFVTNMWNPTSNMFYTGTINDGATINTTDIPLDTQVWTHLALLNLTGAYTNSFAYAENIFLIESNIGSTTNWGFDFNPDKDGMWFEGTGQMACGYVLKNQMSKYTNALNAIHNIGQQADYGIIAASKDKLTTGMQCTYGVWWYYFNRKAVGATTWGMMADKRVNAFWIGTPYEDLDVLWRWNNYEFAFKLIDSNDYLFKDMFVYNNKLYTSHWDSARTMTWDGSILTNAADNQAGSSAAKKYFVYNLDGTGDALYIFSYTTAYGGYSRLYKLVNGHWTICTNLPPAPTPTPDGIVSNYIGDPVIYSNNLYISTSRYVSNNNTNYASIWKFVPGSGWSRIFSNENVIDSTLNGTGVYHSTFNYKLVVFNDGNGEKLYSFARTNGGGTYYVLQWVYNGTSWSAATNVISSTVNDYTYMQSTAVYNSKLYVGIFKNGVFVLNNGTWSRAFEFQWRSAWYSYFYYEPAAMTVWNNKLYVGYNGAYLADNNQNYYTVFLYSHSGNDPFANWNPERCYTNIVPSVYNYLAISGLAVYNSNLYMGVSPTGTEYQIPAEGWRITN